MNTARFGRLLPSLILLALLVSPCLADNRNTSFSELQRLAEEGDADAQVQLGLRYRRGHDVPRDDHMAHTWFRKAADRGHADGQNNLGLLYDHGRGVERNVVIARLWYFKAAKQGHSNAQYNLALLYANGQGVPQDDIEAYAWANVSAAQGTSTLAKELRDKLKRALGPMCMTKAQEQSKAYFEQYVVPFQTSLDTP